MEAASNRTQRLTACPSDFRLLLFFLLLATLIFSGCVSLRVDRINDGADVPLPAPELKKGAAALTDVLARHGAPTDILDMRGKFALVYRRSYYRGGQISIGIPLSDVIKTGFNLEAAGNLMRHDLLVFVFTNDGVLEEMTYEKGSERPLWNTFWK
jgi:hypothetical protein